MFCPAWYPSCAPPHSGKRGKGRGGKKGEKRKEEKEGGKKKSFVCVLSWPPSNSADNWQNGLKEGGKKKKRGGGGEKKEKRAGERGGGEERKKKGSLQSFKNLGGCAPIPPLWTPTSAFGQLVITIQMGFGGALLNHLEYRLGPKLLNFSILSPFSPSASTAVLPPFHLTRKGGLRIPRLWCDSYKVIVILLLLDLERLYGEHHGRATLLEHGTSSTSSTSTSSS